MESGDKILSVSALVEKEEMKEKIEKRKLVAHSIAFDLETVKGIIDKDKTRFFARLGLFKPKNEEIECESVQLFYEPFIVAKANYFLDYYKKKTYIIEVGQEVSEVIALGQTFKPKVTTGGGILKRSYKAIAFDAQERVIHKAATHMALNRTGREINPTKLPSGSIEPEPEKALKREGISVRELKVSPDIILNMIRSRTAKRPSDAERIVEEVFEVKEYSLVCTPIYEARCRRLKTGETKIIPVSGVTANPLSL